RDDYDKYQSAGVEVFGVNPGSAGTHKKFSEKHGLRTPLLLDNGGKVSRTYDALMPIPVLTIVNRTVVGIDRDGIVRFYERGMPSTQHILDAMSAAPANAQSLLCEQHVVSRDPRSVTLILWLRESGRSAR